MKAVKQLLPKNKIIKIDKQWISDKENRQSIDECKFKKFSVDLHKHSSDNENRMSKKKSIMNEDISIFLENSHQKSSQVDRQAIEVDLHLLNTIIQEKRSISLMEVLQDEAQQLKNHSLKQLMLTLVQELKREAHEKTDSISSTDTHIIELSDTCLRPYIQREIQLMQKNRERLIIRKNQLLQIKQVDYSHKINILSTLKHIHQQQMSEILSLEA